MQGVTFRSWAPAESPVRIDYSLQALEEIQRAQVVSPRRARGRAESGGVLFGGFREGNVVQVVAAHPVPCEHARGPAFVLSERDRQHLEATLHREMDAPRLAPVGLYICRASGEIYLNESDLALFTQYFPAERQVALVLVRSKDAGARGGFFVRQLDGSVQTIKSHLEFDLARPAIDRAATAGSAVLPGAKSGRQAARANRARVSRGWARAARWAAAVLLGAAVGQAAYMLLPPRPLNLAIRDRNGQMQVFWDRDAAFGATDATLDITEGSAGRRVVVNSNQLVTGNLTYVRSSGDVTVRMTVHRPYAWPLHETARFIGRAPLGLAPKEVRAVREENGRLGAEIAQLHESIGLGQASVRRLEQGLHALERTLQIDSGR